MVHRYSLRRDDKIQSELVDDENGDLVSYALYAELEQKLAELQPQLVDQRELTTRAEQAEQKLEAATKATEELQVALEEQGKKVEEHAATIEDMRTVDSQKDQRIAHLDAVVQKVRETLSAADPKPPPTPVEEIVAKFIADFTEARK